MKVIRDHFFKNVRKAFGKLSQEQVDGFNAILNHWEISGYKDIRWLAYMLATVWHETDKTMAPIEEYGKGKTRPYGKKIKHSGVSYIYPNKIYYGRGFVMLTWFENYQLMSRLIGIDILANPELCLILEVSIQVMFEGMTKGASSFGDFTGRCLEMYFNETANNPIGARKIINGTDKAELIAGYHNLFVKAITLS